MPDLVYADLLDDCQIDTSHPEFQGLTVNEQRLFEGAAAACRAAFYGEIDKWPIAETDLAEVDDAGVSFRCLITGVHEALRDLVEAHQADPTAQFKLSGSTHGHSCPRVTMVEPQQGAASGNYVVELHGENLPAIDLIYFGNETLTVETDGDTATLTVPPAPENAEWSEDGTYHVFVWTESLLWAPHHQASFVYVRSAQPTGSSASETPPTDSSASETPPTDSSASETPPTTTPGG